MCAFAVWGEGRGGERGLPERRVTWSPQDGPGEGGGERMGRHFPSTLRSPLHPRPTSLAPPRVPVSLGAVWTGAELKGVGPAPPSSITAPHEEASAPPSS